eukprot:GHVO01037016.1.p1 GENE.GHVO01037016.1~~GHVO01037016.1.p1  ORF type:complete len:323 (+),score=36.78 GHVO01037016.1:46-1014(+)
MSLRCLTGIARIGSLSRILQSGCRSYTPMRGDATTETMSAPVLGMSPLPTTNSETTKRSINSKFVKVDDVSIHYEKTGMGNHVVLLLPGALGSSKTDFGYQMQNFNKDIFTLIGWDPRGYGKSRPPVRDWPEHFLRRDAEDAAKFMEEVTKTMPKNVNQDKFSLLGWSDGGITAMILAAMIPEKIRKMVVWGANAFVTKEEIEIYEKIRDVNQWSGMMRKPFEDVYGPEYFSEQFGNWVDAFSKYETNPDGDICRTDLSKITCPTLVIHGEKDPLVPRFHADYLMDNISNSQLKLFPEGKHNLHMRFNKEFNSIAEQFLLEP